MALFDLVLTLALAGAAEPVSHTACPSLLEIPGRAGRVLAEVLGRGPRDPTAVAHVAMSAGEINQLFARGVTSGPSEFAVHPDLDHPTVARWRVDRRDLRVGDRSRGERERAIEEDAWVRAVVELVRTRAGRPGPVPWRERDTWARVIAELRPMHPSLREEPFTPDLARLRWAAAETPGLPFEEPFACDLETSGYLEEILNAGPDYARLVARQRLRAWALLLGVRWDDIDRPDSRARAGLLRLHADLPGHAGFRVSLDAKAFNRIRWSADAEPKILGVDLCFVVGLGAYDDEDRRVLADVVRRHGRR